MTLDWPVAGGAASSVPRVAASTPMQAPGGVVEIYFRRFAETPRGIVGCILRNRNGRDQDGPGTQVVHHDEDAGQHEERIGRRDAPRRGGRGSRSMYRTTCSRNYPTPRPKNRRRPC